MRALTRGTALPETALVLGIALIMILGAVQSTVIGYSQVSADGAAFVAAHTTAIDGAANAPTVVASAFPDLNPNAIATAQPSPDLQQATVSKSVDGFLMVPGLASSYQLNGSDVEYAPAAAARAPQDFSFSIGATLNNYCPSSGICSPRPIWLAQSVNTQGAGNGWNGTFTEWRCHQQYYASVNWPSQRPTGGLAGTTFDPQTHNGVEYPIYSWDTTHACK